MTRVVVSGALANKPDNGGNAWTRLSWVLGFTRLGFDVSFVEQIAPTACVDWTGHMVPFADSLNLAYFREVTQQFAMTDSATLLCGDGEHTCGLSWTELEDLADEADLLFNMSGHLQGPLRRRFRRSVFFDDDPGFTQFWWAQGNAASSWLADHDYWFTIGENVGLADCSIPLGGIPWRSARVPVTLEEWPVCQADNNARFTSVGTWRGPYGPVQHAGKTYGLKVHEFRKMIELPTRVGLEFEIALDIHPDEVSDLAALTANRWVVIDPKRVARTPDTFRGYVQRSGAEFSVAQGIYVATQSGWFSDRTVRYLASGKPVLVQDTGFSRHYPVGDGLIAFHTLDEAVAGAERIVRDYDMHARAAREVAEAYFDATRVVGQLAEQIGVAP